MFKSQRVPCYLNSFSGHGDDPDNKELKLVFHVFQISLDLAKEVSPFVADRIFREVAGEWEQAREVSKIAFSTIQVPMQNITFFSLGEESLLGDSPAKVLGAAISNLRATRDNGAIRLEFDVVIPMDRLTMELIQKYYKSTCFLTMEEIQRKIEVVVDEVNADLQGDLQSLADAEPEPVEVGAGDSKSPAAADDSGAFINRRNSRKRK